VGRNTSLLFIESVPGCRDKRNGAYSETKLQSENQSQFPITNSQSKVRVRRAENFAHEATA